MRINIYSDKGVRVQTPIIWADFFEHQAPDVEIHYVEAKNILEGNPNAILFPGGSASVFAKSLGKKKRKKIIDWVNNGGKYIGVCAGAYLASSTYDWSLGISPVKIARPWQRGHHTVRIVLGVEYKKVDYFNGPIFTQWPNVEIIARFMDDIPDAIGQHNMPTSPAIVKNHYGKGRVLLFSPHLEKTNTLHPILYDLIKRFVEDK